MGKDFDPLDVLAAQPVKAKPATSVSDATAAAHLETLVRETRETRRALEQELQKVTKFTEKTAFWCSVIGVPVLIGLLLAVASFFMGLGGGIAGR